MIHAWIHSIAALYRRFSVATGGGVALIGALSVTSVVGVGAFAVEASQGYSAKVSNQRIADMASLAGALAYNVNSNTTEMINTAKAAAVAQGITADQTAVALVTDAASGRLLVQVTVTTSVPLKLAKVLSSAASYDVSATGSASISTTTTVAPPCIAALNGAPTNGISMSGGTILNASGCAINANAGFSLVGGTTVTARQINSAKAVSVTGGSTITTAPTANNIQQNVAGAASDWMATDSGLLGLLCKVNQLSGYSDPDYGDGNRTCTTPQVLPTTVAAPATTTDVTLNYSPAALISPYWNSSTNTYTFPSNAFASIGNTIRTLTVNGGITAIFQGPINLTIRNVAFNGSGATFGDGNLTVTGLFDFANGTKITMGNGNHSFGTLNVSGGRSLDVGSGNFNLGGGMAISGGSVVRIAASTGDVVAIGNASGTAINLGNGSVLCFTAPSGAGCAAPTVAIGSFSADGHIVTGGGSTLVFPKAVSHAIDGFGSGSYYINGNFSNLTGGAMTGTDVSFGLAGTYSLAGGTSLDLAAPGTTSTFGVPGVLFATKTSTTSTMGGGATGRYAGLVYAPKSAVTLSGGASMSSNGSNCLMMIVSTLTMSGGTSVASTCSGFSGITSTTQNVALYK